VDAKPKLNLTYDIVSKLHTPDETIPIGFTDQRVSGSAGLLTFASFLHWLT
jgi:hypothetical protein